MDEAQTGPARVLEALGYHREVASYLKTNEAEVWAWMSSVKTQDEHVRAMRDALLRQTYRLTEPSHAEVFQACRVALERLTIDGATPVTLYQAPGAEMNAALVFVPGEIHLVFHGPTLERLGGDELLALLGHEFAHYRLWSEDNGDQYTAWRILEHTLSDGRPAASHVETARLFNLHTEVFADRGAALSGGPQAAIATLVKAHTGIGQVDAKSYLAQAEELDRDDGKASLAPSHPELFLRARVLDKWWNGDLELDGWMRTRLRGPLSMAALDLMGQVKLETLTRRFIARFVAGQEFKSDAIDEQVKSYFPDWQGAAEVPIESEALSDISLDDSVRDYLCFVMLDLALADADLRDPAVLATMQAAHEMGRGETFAGALRRDAGFTKRKVDSLTKKLKTAS